MWFRCACAGYEREAVVGHVRLDRVIHHVSKQFCEARNKRVLCYNGAGSKLLLGAREIRSEYYTCRGGGRVCVSVGVCVGV